MVEFEVGGGGEDGGKGGLERESVLDGRMQRWRRTGKGKRESQAEKHQAKRKVQQLQWMGNEDGGEDGSMG